MAASEVPTPKMSCSRSSKKAFLQNVGAIWGGLTSENIGRKEGREGGREGGNTEIV